MIILPPHHPQPAPRLPRPHVLRRRAGPALRELTHVCDTEQEALDIISKTPDVSAIATDAGGRVYLAKDNGKDFRIV